MDSLDNLQIQVSFDTVYNILNTRQQISDNGKANLKRAINFMEVIVRSIDSLDKKENIYYFVPNLKEIINSIEPKTKISKEKVNKSRKYWSKLKTDLELLLQDPQKAFSSPVDDTKKAVSKIMDIYSLKPCIIEKALAFSEIF